MKKLVSAMLITGLTFSGIYAGTADAMSGNTLDSVKSLQHGDRTVEGVTIGERMSNVFRDKGHGIHTTEAYGHHHYYEFHTKEGVMIVTANGAGRNAKVTRVSMSYNKLNGPKYQEVKSQVSANAIKREHHNKVTGGSGYISDGNITYQFGSSHPKDQTLKLYRIDVE
ncbi:SA0570 family protein [Staphylococcus intermedius]|uniref:Exported protein n=1 Tax=Staphylococcus intermedius NCTC 11048 TaxID=1141106 RepID=A0A380GBF8_STAIN|nr:hypothetical protein [Staphylococcus intermedius]PCF65588.1 hypothetical protein B5C04_05920 [Staphylococcus intermedius]PCF81267.1 hypothetical protein B4W74_06270 [Staphylococcus intermedius]PCF82550.1 hypothetical protein B4W70_05915 [Staphylococcus intermedius]PCF87249.1 hypothetical protein B4W75_09185 [Staphylococcus intermedius]PCF87810.1 hypothetical protein B4W76_05310 [Staphylococcus intermedius]